LSISIRDLWPNIDQLDKADHEGTSAFVARSPRRGPLFNPRANFQGTERTGEDTSCAIGKASEDAALSPSSIAPKGHGGGSMKNKATQILVDAPGAILPQMRRSFVDRQYSASTGLDRSEWEIILEELICMGFIVKQEPISEGGD
jgi:hypothetical protein